VNAAKVVCAAYLVLMALVLLAVLVIGMEGL
jgi:hypothetical protein